MGTQPGWLNISLASTDGTQLFDATGWGSSGSAHPADIVITDLFMPDSDGFEAIDGLRRQFPRVKIVAISGGAQFSKRDYLPDAKLVGVDATLQKPFEIATLVETLRTLTAP